MPGAPQECTIVPGALLALRRTSAALALGSLHLCDGPAGTLVYERAGFGERWRVLVNFANEPVDVAERGRVVVASDGGGEGTAWRGRLAPAQAVILTCEP